MAVKKGVAYHAIATHVRPHLDEITGMWLLRRFGEEAFPGISQAQMIVLENFDDEFSGRTPAELEAEGILCIGIGHGRFDEHLAEGGRKEETCAAMLVAETLPSSVQERVGQILKYALEADSKGHQHAFSLATLTKQLCDYEDVGTVIGIVETMLDAKYNEQKEFFDAVEEFKARGKTEEVTGPWGPATIAWIESDNLQMQKAVRSKALDLENLLVFVQKNTSGNVQVYPNGRGKKHFMQDVTRIVRYGEQTRRNKFKTTNMKELGSPGTVAGAEEWYFAEGNGDFLLNGSKTTLTDPTVIPFEEIIELVKLAVNPEAWPKDFAKKCQSGKCTSGKNNLCPLFGVGLSRCRKIRFEQHHNKEAAA